MVLSEEQKEKRMKENEPKRPVGCHQVYKHKHNMRRNERKGQKIFEEIMLKNIPNFMKDMMNLHIPEAQKFPR